MPNFFFSILLVVPQRYLGTVREDGTLNILLEFVPGGSISSLLGKFGSFPESVSSSEALLAKYWLVLFFIVTNLLSRSLECTQSNCYWGWIIFTRMELCTGI